MRVVVCDDDHVAGEGLCRMVQETIPTECCKYYDDTEELCETIAAGELFDALLLDIEWKGRGTGLLVAEKIRQTAPAIQIVYVTGYT